LGIDATNPSVAAIIDVADTVHVGDLVGDSADVTLTGAAVALLEAFSIRVPFEQSIPEEHRWLLAGLAEVFDVAQP